MWNILDLSLYRKTKELACKPPTKTRVCWLQLVVHPSRAIAKRNVFSLSFARKGRLLPYKTRSDDHKSRARDDKTAGPAATWIIGYAACERQQETRTVSYFCVVGKIDVVHGILSSSLYLSLFFPVVAFPTQTVGAVFSLFHFILFYSFSRCQEHDMIGNIDYL